MWVVDCSDVLSLVATAKGGFVIEEKKKLHLYLRSLQL